MQAPGSISLFKDIFDAPVVSISGRRYREKKIECLIDYYYFKGRQSGLAYPLLLELVSSAFFYSSFTIHDIIQENLQQLHALKLEWKMKEITALQKFLKEKWPHLVW